MKISHPQNRIFLRRKTVFCNSGGSKSGAARGLGRRSQSCNMSFSTSGDSDFYSIFPGNLGMPSNPAFRSSSVGI